jgi:hypothetical protein
MSVYLGVIDSKSDPQAKEVREKVVQSVISGLSRDDRQKLEVLDIYAIRTREEVYRGFIEIDDQLRDLEQSRAQAETQRIEFGNSLSQIDAASAKASPILVHHAHSFPQIATARQRERPGRGCVFW